MTTADATLYGGQPAQHWQEMARKDPDAFLKFAGKPLLTHDEPWIENAYRDAARQNPIHAFVESASFAHRAWAKDILVAAAKQEPGAAFEFFNDYAYAHGKPTHAQVPDAQAMTAALKAQRDGEFAAASMAILSEPDTTVTSAQRVNHVDIVHNSIHKEPVAARVQRAQDEYVSDVAENAPRPWAKDVLLEAARRAPEMTLAFCEKKKSADIPWLIDISIAAEENLPVTRGHRGGVLRALAERREMDTGRGGAAR